MGELGAHLVAEPRELRGGEAPVPVLVEVRERLAGLFGRGSWDGRYLVSVVSSDEGCTFRVSAHLSYCVGVHFIQVTPFHPSIHVMSCQHHDVTHVPI